MKKQVVYCDRCGKEGALTVAVFIDRRMDAAGSMENIHEQVDLCHGCGSSALNHMLSNTAAPLAGNDFVNAYRKKVIP